MILFIFEKSQANTASLLYNISVKTSFSRGVSSFLIIILASRVGVSLDPRAIFEKFEINYCLKCQRLLGN